MENLIEYSIVTSIDKIDRASDYIDSVMDRYGIGKIAIRIEDLDGNPASHIDTGYVTEEGLDMIRHRYRLRKGIAW